MRPVPKVGLDEAKLAEKINAKIANTEPFPKNFKFLIAQVLVMFLLIEWTLLGRNNFLQVIFLSCWFG